jgi:hypothetical protein
MQSSAKHIEGIAVHHCSKRYSRSTVIRCTVYVRELAASRNFVPTLSTLGSFALIQTPSTFVPCAAHRQETSTFDHHLRMLVHIVQHFWHSASRRLDRKQSK